MDLFSVTNMSSLYKVGSSGGGGESLTVTCFSCGMPSSKEWAQRVRSRPIHGFQEPFFPFLLELQPPPPGAIMMEDGTTYLCAFCHALLEAQWNTYEARAESVPPMERKYIIHKFICAVCGIETYRKRVRALPFQEFPFLVKARRPGSITLGNNPLAIVCLDCSETLWAQSAEYDRWGLPVHKRHFNWMARPPPPEDSVEATVARLPSGETQLPRCPPTDPLVPPKTNEPTALPEPIPPVKGSRSRSSNHSNSPPHIDSPPTQGTSSCSTPPKKGSGNSIPHPVVEASTISPNSHGQPPVVTVAPMSSHSTLTSNRKSSVSYPTPTFSGVMGPSSQGKFENSSFSQPRANVPSAHTNTTGSNILHPGVFSHNLFPSPMGLSPPGPFSWPALNPMDNQVPPEFVRNSFTHFGPEHPAPWPWISHASSELLRLQQSSYLSMQGRRMSDHYLQGSVGSLYPASSVTSGCTPSSTRSRGTTPPVAHSSHSEPRFSNPRDETASCEEATKPNNLNIRGNEESPSKENSKLKVVTTESEGSSSSKEENTSPPSERKLLESDDHKIHWKQKLRSCSISKKSPTKEVHRRSDMLLPKKRLWQPPPSESPSSEQNNTELRSVLDKKKRFSVSSSSCIPNNHTPMDFSKKSPSSSTSSFLKSETVTCVDESSEMAAVDLSTSGTVLNKKDDSNEEAPTKEKHTDKFSIAFLCKGEPASTETSNERSSVIVSNCAEAQDESNNSPPSQNVDLQTPSSVEIHNDHSAVDTVIDNVEEETNTDELVSSTSSQLESKRPASDSEEDVTSTPVEPEVRVNFMTVDPDWHIQDEIQNGKIMDEIKKFRMDEDEVKQQKKSFLSNFGLLGQAEKRDVEFDMLKRRSLRNTIPPVKSRVQLKENINSGLEKSLITVAYSDPSLNSIPEDANQITFLRSLGLKVCSKTEKAERETKWRQMLKAHFELDGSMSIKNPWMCIERVTEVLGDAYPEIKSKQDVLEGLRYPQHGSKNVEEESQVPNGENNPLLVSESEDHVKADQSHRSKSNEITSGLMSSDSESVTLNGVCINFPRYIPSYVSNTTGNSSIKEEVFMQESLKGLTRKEILNVPTPTAAPNNATGCSTIPVSSCGSEPLLKIPIVSFTSADSSSFSPSSTTNLISRRSSLSTNRLSTSDDSLSESESNLDEQDEKGKPSNCNWDDVETILKASTAQWEKTKKVMQDALVETDYLTFKENKKLLGEKASQLRIIRKHLKAQQVDMHQTEKFFKGMEKEVLRKLRNSEGGKKRNLQNKIINSD